MDDKTYRRIADEFLEELTVYFEDADPDEIEAELIPGALSLTTADGCKYIVNEQGAHQQMWLATPTAGRRYNYDEATQTWVDSKDGTRLREVLAAALTEKLGRPIAFPRPTATA